MNSVNFSNVGGGIPSTAGSHLAQGAMKQESVQPIIKFITQTLQSKGPLTGWRAEVPMQDRVTKVYQM
jgi:hypothetical protein